MVVDRRLALTPGPLAAQTAHALTAFAARHPEHRADWAHGSLVVLVTDEPGLLELAAWARSTRTPHGVFREPDPPWYGAITGLALAGTPAARHRLRKLKLVGR